MNRLRKRDVEVLLDAYDDDPEGALTAALARVLGRDGTFDELVTAAGFGPDRTTALARRDQSALDGLLAELNELRTLPS